MGKTALRPMGAVREPCYWLWMNPQHYPQFTTVSRTLLASLLLGVAASGAAFAAGSASATNSSNQTATGSNTGSMNTTAGVNGSETAPAGTARSSRHFVKKAHEIEQKQIALSELAQTRASNPQVKSFAEQLVTEHTRMTTDLTALGGADMQGVARSSSKTTDSAAAWNGSSANSAATSDTTSAGVAYNSPMQSNSSTRDTTTVADSGTPSGAYAGKSDDAEGHHGWAYKRLASKSGADFDKAYLKAIIDEHEDAIKQFEKASKNNDDPAVQSFAAKYLPTLRQHLTQAQELQKTLG
ncbi:MAG: hypothetical protein JWM88_522 [Verrucomicrobia bacterium]|nr:hypothetical protein [Verrucomicrobiota bacterium]